jgi:hypothetical protein
MFPRMSSLFSKTIIVSRGMLRNNNACLYGRRIDPYHYIISRRPHSRCDYSCHHTLSMHDIRHSKNIIPTWTGLHQPIILYPQQQQPWIHRHCYSTSRQSRAKTQGGGGDNSNKVPSSSSSSSSSTSYLETLPSQATKWWNKAVAATNNVVKDAASKTLDTSQKLAHQAAQQTQQWTQEAANQAVQSASKLSQSATKVAQQQTTNLSKTTSQTFAKVTTATQQSLQQRESYTSERIRHTKERLFDYVTGGGTKLLRWLGVWSLAAIFVYGIATTLPIQLIKYSMETTTTTTTKEDYHNNVLPVESTRPEKGSTKPIFRWWA